MKKELLQSFISKYSLGGQVEEVVWEGTEKSLKTKFVASDKSVLGDIELKEKVPSLEGLRLGIYDTSKVSKFLSILDDEIKVSATTVGDQPKSLKLEDASGDTATSYALSDTAVIPAVPALKTENLPKEYEVSVKITDAFVEKLAKAKAALPKVVLFSVNATNKKVEFTLGHTDVNDDTITLVVPINKTKSMEKLFFNANLLVSILSANKGVETELLISKEGIARLTYASDECTADYYFIGKTTEE